MPLVRDHLTAALHTAVRTPILAQIGSLDDDLGRLFDRTEGQNRLSFLLRLVWSDEETVDRLSLEATAAESVMERFENLPPLTWQASDVGHRGATDVATWIMGESETPAPPLRLNCF